MLVYRVVLLAVAAFTLVCAEEAAAVTTSRSGDLPVAEINKQYYIDTDASISDHHRQGRTSLHAELPSSKAKREQALRNILAARRRQILGQQLRDLRASRPLGVVLPKDTIIDVLEVQETRHDVYIAATTDVPAEVVPEEAGPEPLTRTLTKGTSEKPAVLADEFRNSTSKYPESLKQIVQPRNSSNENVTKSIPNGREISNLASNTRTNYNSIVPRNSSSSSTNQKSPEHDVRRKNTVPMPESLYNHFRPVESNIPLEDMSQFLYFGQKLHPESQNTTGNNSVEVTPTAPTIPSPRHRFFMKRFSTTTPAPVPRLEEIINEEMNIAVERQTVEKNKISKIKNAFRSPGSGIYYRKPPVARASDSVICVVCNAIVTADGKNVSGTGASVKSETDSRTSEFPVNPSAHAVQYRVAGQERGSASHEANVTRNAANSTQISDAQRHRGSENPNEEGTRLESVDTVERMNSTVRIVGGVVPDKQSEDLKAAFHRNKKSGAGRTTEKNVWGKMNEMLDKETIERNDAELLTSIEANGDAERQQSDFLRSVRTFSIDDRIKENRSQTQNLMEISSNSSRNDVGTSTIPTTNERDFASSTMTILSNHKSPSTFGLVVEKAGLNDSSSFDEATTRRYDNADFVDGTQVDSLGRSNVGSRTSPIPSINNNTDDLSSQATFSASSSAVPPVASGVQQHVYAYTITNVTRLLRNYTGPGLSKEEQLAGSPSADTSEIRTDSSRAIEAARSRPELSAVTAVEGAGTTVLAVRDRATAATSQRWATSGGGNVAQSVNKVSTVVGASADEITELKSTLASPSTTGDFDEVGTKVRDLVADGNGTDQRVLQKSASAVLNQRTGGRVSLDDRDDLLGRVGIQGFRSQDQLKNRRIKVLDVGAGTDVASSSSLTDDRSWPRMGNGSMPEGEVQSRGDVKFAGGRLRANERQRFWEAFEGRDLDSVMLGDRLSQGSLVTSDHKGATLDITMTVLPPRGTFDLTLVTSVDPERERVTISEYQDAYTTSNQMPVSPDTNVPDDNYHERNKTWLSSRVAKASNDTLDDTGVGASAVSSDKDENVGGDRVKSKFAATSTEMEFESTTIVAKKDTVQSTVATAVFPVTPRILTDVTKVTNREQQYAARATEDVTEVPEAPATVTPKINRPFGMAEDLDPSEIQKMYRLPSTPKPEATIGTVLPEVEQKWRPAIEHEDPDLSSVDSQRIPNGRRSPEVRARNLSDKAKDKDNVLPIMHLYNTSDIFNGTDSIDARPRQTESSHFVSLANDASVEPSELTDEETSGNAVASVTTANPALGTILAKNERIDVPRSSHNTHDRLPDSTEGKAANTRKDKHDGNREASYDTNLTMSGTSPSFSTGNRTRQKTTYRPSVLEFSTLGYPAKLNRTYFESSLISGSSRESVNISEVISKRHDGDTIATQETVAVVSYILATLVVFPIAVGVGLILRRLIIRNRKVLEESDTSSEISCRKDALNLENGDFKTSIEKAITKLPRIQHLCHEAEKPPPPPSQESRWEFPRDKLRLQTVLGQGNFGQVWKAEADDLTGHQGTTRLVAVKTVKEGASVREKEDLVRELEIMQQLSNHPNVVTLLGCCTEEEPHYLILEYVMYGKLLAYLRDHRTRQDFYNFSEDSAALTSRDLTVFGYCVARGMEYLASKKIIHRDLAARNVLVDHNKLCKIADFGMSRFANADGEVIETRHGRNALPIRWMAPESLIYSLFTTKTDVWSFGILMWEIVTLGSTPYPDMTAREVMRNVQNGYRLERPSHCRSELFRVISRCWHADPDRRPEFQTLRRDLAQLLEDNMNGHYVDLESFASECTD